MPTYEFECTNPDCDHRHSIIMKISEYDSYPKTCPECGSPLMQDYSNRDGQAVHFKGGGWTPKFGPVNRG